MRTTASVTRREVDVADTPAEETTSRATPTMLTSEVASGIPQTPTR